MLWVTSRQWRLLRQMIPTWQTATGLAALATLLCLYSDRHHLRELIVEVTGNHELRLRLEEMKTHHLHLMEEQRLELEKKMKEKELEQDKKILELEKEMKEKQLEQAQEIVTLKREVIALKQKNTTTASAEEKPPVTFLDLPRELRDEIYELVAPGEWEPKFCPWFPDSGIRNHSSLFPPNYRDPALAQVHRQIRAEFLPYFHRLMLVTFDVPIRPSAERWLKVFESRLPLIRSYRFQGFPFLIIRLSGGFEWKGRMPMTAPTKEEGVIAGTEFTDGGYAGRYATHVQQLVESLVIRGEDGVAYLSIEGLRTISDFSWSFDFMEYERDPENFVFLTLEESKTSADAQMMLERED